MKLRILGKQLGRRKDIGAAAPLQYVPRIVFMEGDQTVGFSMAILSSKGKQWPLPRLRTKLSTFCFAGYRIKPQQSGPHAQSFRRPNSLYEGGIQESHRPNHLNPEAYFETRDQAKQVS